ncbi:Hsp70 family protein [Candidatus Methylospira mobilis]|uniref:Hsp70 family protein n=1 Tax=Candidatus Methylospira mobilis TaxID=1808979 RepID=UPI0028EE053C|nr:Hsp70 family protein [Candidatus Methylospira mobilis]WNV03094.1 Hsp70 family protein [Candidatus Methylospira mobilis]
MTNKTLGLDFGTTNSVAALLSEDGTPTPLEFQHHANAMSVFRSVLCFWEEQSGRATLRLDTAGPWAIERFIEDPHDCRLVQSFKSFAASRLFNETLIFGKRYAFEDLLSTFLGNFWQNSGIGGCAPPKRIIMGRPVSFVGANPDEALAIKRYETALRRFGFNEIHYVYEPVAAAFFFAQRLTRDANVLVADFGGGTSDFSVIRFGQSGSGIRSIPMGHRGLPLAGDTFDYRIIDNAISPQMGKGSRYLSINKQLEIPGQYYVSFARWNELSLLRSPATLRELKQLADTALEPDGLNRFIRLLETNAIYALYRSVSDAKVTLSGADGARLKLDAPGVQLEADIERADFENWIAEDVARIGHAVDTLLADIGLVNTGIDRVFLTGGTSFVPAVRRLFSERFGDEKIETGNQFDSIAQGLALIGQERDIGRWNVKNLPA